MPDMYVLITRIVIAGLLGGIIGAEREFRAKIAGTRTHLLVAVGAAHEGVEALHHEGPPPGRELLVPHGRQTRPSA